MNKNYVRFPLNMDEESINFYQKTAALNPGQRMTAKQALEH